MKTKAVSFTRSETTPRRTRPTLATRFPAVAAASPGTYILGYTNAWAKAPKRPTSRYRTPAVLARRLGEFITGLPSRWSASQLTESKNVRCTLWYVERRRTVYVSQGVEPSARYPHLIHGASRWPSRPTAAPNHVP